jgi:hypothetical protein
MKPTLNHNLVCLFRSIWHLSKTLMRSIRGIDPSAVISQLFLVLDYKYPRVLLIVAWDEV